MSTNEWASPSVATVLHTAMAVHGVLAVVYGGAALANPAALEPLHAPPSETHLHWFRLFGGSMVAVGLLALYAAVAIADRVHTYWLGAALWVWTGLQAYVTYYDYLAGGAHSTYPLVVLLVVLMAVYSVAFLAVALLPGTPVTEHLRSHANHHERHAASDARHAAKAD